MRMEITSNSPPQASLSLPEQLIHNDLARSVQGHQGYTIPDQELTDSQVWVRVSTGHQLAQEYPN